MFYESFYRKEYLIDEFEYFSEHIDESRYSIGRVSYVSKNKVSSYLLQILTLIGYMFLIRPTIVNNTVIVMEVVVIR